MQHARSYVPAALWTLALIPMGWSQSAEKIFIEPRSRIPVELHTAEPAHLRVDASLVLVPANVSTEFGARVTDLRKENFRLFQDGAEQPITYFSTEDAPLSVGLLFDTSGSMGNKMKQATAAAAEFFKTAGAQDEFFLVEFNERPKLTVPFTADPDDLVKHVRRVHPMGRTSLLDAVMVGLAQLKKARNSRKALVVLSDGADNRSRASYAEVRSAVMESEVQLYAMGIFDSLEGRKGTPEEQNGPKLLDELAAESGGKHYRANVPDDLPGISARIGNELRSQYLIGFIPEDLQADGKYHRVKVQLDAPGKAPSLRVHYRPGYYAPGR